MGDKQFVFDFVETIERYQSVEEILAGLTDNLGRFGFDHLIFTGLPEPGEPLAPLIRTSLYPTEWLDRYLDEDYHLTDHTCIHAMNTATPFFWHDAPMSSDVHAANQVAGEAVEFGLVDGYVIPLYSRDHWQSIMSLSSRHRLDLSPAEQGAVQLMSIFAANAIEKLHAKPKTMRRLSAREIEVLEWYALGKTIWETSVILGISERTVKYHRANVIRKMNAANMVHAMSKATQEHLITPDQLSLSTGDNTH